MLTQGFGNVTEALRRPPKPFSTKWRPESITLTKIKRERVMLFFSICKIFTIIYIIFKREEKRER